MSAEERQIEPENGDRQPVVDQAAKARIIAALRGEPLQKTDRPEEKAIPSTLPANRDKIKAKVAAALKLAKTPQKSGEIREYTPKSIGEILQFIQSVTLGRALDNIFSDSKTEIMKGIEELTATISILEKLDGEIANEATVQQIIAKFKGLIAEILDTFDKYADIDTDIFHSKIIQTYQELAAFIDGLILGNNLTPGSHGESNFLP